MVERNRQSPSSQPPSTSDQHQVLCGADLNTPTPVIGAPDALENFDPGKWMFWQRSLIHVARVMGNPRLGHAELRARIDAGLIDAVDRWVRPDGRIQTVVLELDFLRSLTKHWANAWAADEILAAGRKCRNEPHPPDYGSDPWINDIDPAVFKEPGKHCVFLACAAILRWWPDQSLPTDGVSDTPPPEMLVEHDGPFDTKPITGSVTDVISTVTNSGDSPTEACTRKFLTDLMREDRANEARHSKANLKAECQNKYKISGRAFDQIWTACIKAEGAVAYKKSGPRGAHTVLRPPR